MRYIVTGGAGFIGSRLVRALVERGDEAIVADDLSGGDSRRLPAAIELHRLNVEKPDIVKLIEEISPQAVFHLAAQVSVGSSMQDPAKDALSNVIGTLHVLQGCASARCKIVFSSTCAVYGETGRSRRLKETSPAKPVAAYGLSKWIAEQYIRNFSEWQGVDYTILRYANVYGPGQTANGEGGVVARFMQNIALGLPLIIHGDGNQTRDFIHVDDVVQANLAAVKMGTREICNISTGKETSINDLAAWCERLSGRKMPREFVPRRKGDIRYSRLSPLKAVQILGWRPSITLKEGLASIYNQRYISYH